MADDPALRMLESLFDMQTDMVEKIVMYTDDITQRRLYDSGILVKLGSGRLVSLVEANIMTVSRETHKRLLQRCLTCLHSRSPMMWTRDVDLMYDARDTPGRSSVDIKV